ncbi:MAG: hypothetical protein J5806_01180 [Lentisphaeria bacterium]|nr:hypothetical protein [Lentisphaeria bacterium]
MKTGKIAITAAAFILCSVVKADPWPNPAQRPAPAAEPAASPAAAKSDSPAKPPQLTAEETAKLAQLQAEKTELLRKIVLKRTELLKNDPKLQRMYIQLLKQTRALALELDSNREMRELNDALADVEKKMKKITDK